MNDWLVIEDSILNNVEINLIYKNLETKTFKNDRFNEYFLTGCFQYN